MGARSNHKYYITRYPLGLDATVSKSRAAARQTMRFTNDIKGPDRHPQLALHRSGGVGWVRYEIWGIPDGRTVSLSGPRVSNVLQAHHLDRLRRHPAEGRQEQVEYPSNGMTTSVTRVVRDAKGRVIHNDTWVSHYVLWNGIINVGR